MKIKSIEISNFRSIQQLNTDCVNFNTLVGPNGSGKSTVLNALNVFFGEITSFTVDDFHRRDTSNPISIKVIFHQLSDVAQKDFEHYVRGGQLVVQAEVSEVSEGKFERIVRGERLVFEPFRSFFEVKTAKERGEIFKKLRGTYEGIENATNDAGRRAALFEFEEALDDEQKTLTPSGEEFFGVSKGSHVLQRHISWVYVPAVKDASSESEEAKSSHLGRLIQHTIRSGMNYETELEKIREEALTAYQSLLTGQKTHLSTLQQRLSDRLKAVVTAEADLALDWKKDEKSVAVQDPVAQVLLTDRGFSGEVDKFGHGLQRSFLLVILQELMAGDSEVSPTLILGCEEPELYQHPPQARHLAQIMMELSGGDAQVLITTHSPYFVDVEFYDGIKMFRNVSGASVVSASTFGTVLNGYNTAFGKPLGNEDQVKTKLAIQTQPKFNEIFFSDKVVLVEGISDLACFETYLRLSGKKADFQKSGISAVVCEGKSSLALMMLIAKEFNIPHHVVFDCDANCAAQHQAVHIRDNDAILSMAGLTPLGAFPASHIFEPNLTAWVNAIEQVLEDEYGAESAQFNQAGSNAVGSLGNAKKYPLYVTAAITAAWDNGRRFPVLEKAVNAILN